MIDAVTYNDYGALPIKGREGQSPSLPPSSEANDQQVDDSFSVQNKAEVKAYQQRKVENDGAAAKTNAGQKKTESPEKQNETQVEESIRHLNEKMNILNREILFKVDERIGKQYISIIDKKTKAIIKEIPPEEIRNFIAQLKKFQQSFDGGGDVRDLLVDLEV